jgi:hypothetical protein
VAETRDRGRGVLSETFHPIYIILYAAVYALLVELEALAKHDETMNLLSNCCHWQILDRNRCSIRVALASSMYLKLLSVNCCAPNVMQYLSALEVCAA